MAPNLRKAAPDAALEIAIARYRALSRKRQLQALSELLETRARELTLAYAGVTRVGIGWRRRRDRRGHGVVCWQETPCVLFMVRRKWSKRSAARDGAIPKHLLTYADNARGKRVLIAVPTDVDASWMGSLRLESVIHAYPNLPGTVNRGIVCTVLRRSDQPGLRFGLSCRHVLSTGLRASAPLAGVSTDVARLKQSRIGDVAPHWGASPLDAQVFLVTDVGAALPTHAGYVTSEAAVPVPLQHQAPSLGVADRKVKFRGRWEASLDADLDAEEWMFAGELLEIDLPKKRTRKGDSGSAVTSLDNRTLVGMHIGSARSKHVDGFVSVCIPAWRLMDARNFVGLPIGVTWRLS